ncbi:hypothetical protein WJX73_009344 [Symbiochloris irregularis]|uniref:YqaJ viral recombinase domain-containing protein n=1 Tax=Symbiochloris irregularis TaxID=706552 RepID=A0AAW1PD67_9CHLO
MAGLSLNGSGPVEAVNGQVLVPEQNSPQWHRLRHQSLTASAFGSAIGLFTRPKREAGGLCDRQALWEEKLGLKAPFRGNMATAHGSRNEGGALEIYKQASGHAVKTVGIRQLRRDCVHSWLAGSPDGLIQEGSALDGELEFSIHQVEGPGLLEIKCPWKKQQVPDIPNWYHMPQVQGLMEIFKLEWCDLYMWTENGGSAVFHIQRDRDYWAKCFTALSEFYYGHVLPGRISKHYEGAHREGLEEFRPEPEHELAEEIRERSKAMAEQAIRSPVTSIMPPYAAGSVLN